MTRTYIEAAAAVVVLSAGYASIFGHYSNSRLYAIVATVAAGVIVFSRVTRSKR